MQTNTVSLQHLAERAKQAHYGTSFSPEERGKQMIKGYEEELNSDLEAIKDATHEAKEQYKQRYIKFLGAYMSAKSRIVSPMISGPSNFPVRRMEKYNNWERSAYDKFQEFRDKALNGIKKQIERDKPEEQKNDEAWQKIERNILRTAQTIMDIDNGINRHSSRPLFVSSITGLIQRMAKNGQAEHVKKSIELIRQINGTHLKPIITERNEIFSLIEKAEAVQETKKDEANREPDSYPFEGGEVVLNYPENRVQIKHDKKPTPEVIAKLKAAGCKWSPRNMAWQLFLHNQAIYKANEMTGANIPYQK